MKFSLNQLNLATIAAWPIQFKLIATTILSTVCLMLGYGWYIKTELHSLAKAIQYEQTLKHQYQTKQRLSSSYLAYQQQLHILNKTLTHLERLLPNSTALNQLLADISQVGMAKMLIFKSLKPQAEIKHTFYSELPMQLEVVGNYQQLAAFVNRLSQLKHLVTVADFLIEPDSKTNPNFPEHSLLQMTMSIKAYYHPSVAAKP